LLGCSPPVVEQAKLLGTKPFTKEAWAAANKLDRAQMLWSFLSQHDVNALTPMQIRELLGSDTCYSGYDVDPTYCVGPDTVDNGWGKGYMVVFINDRRGSRKIREVDISPEPE
jgi:hypothetical protein